MSNSTSIIEINGRRFDSQTGQAVNAPATKPAGVSVDGVLGHTPLKTGVLVSPQRKNTGPIQPLSDTKLMDMKAPKRHPRPVAKAAAAHSPQTAHTLMRHVVKKPSPSHKRQYSAQGHTDKLVAAPQAAVAVTRPSHAVPANRLKRAAEATKSAHISRFSGAKNSYSQPALAPVGNTSVATVATKPLDIFEQAMQRATSHQQSTVQHHKHPARHHFLSKRVVSLTATAFSVLLLVGFIGFENRASLTLHMAAGKAGFNAVMPGYRPSGFSVGRVNYSAGTVAINFHSNSDQRAFAISEKPSAWDSATLRDSLVAQADHHYQTVGIGGRTVYIYGTNNAAWVNGGILYQVNTDGALSNKQLSQLAASL